MTEPQFYVEDVGDQNPTIWYSDLDGQCHIVARLSRGVESPYEDLAFAVLARVLAPDEVTVERMATVLHDLTHGTDCPADGPGAMAHKMARAVLAALAEPAEVSP